MFMESVVRSSCATGLAKVPSSSPKMFSVQITIKNRGPVMSAEITRQREERDHLALGQIPVVRRQGGRALLHPFEHRGFGLTGQPVVLVDQDDVGHELARFEVNFAGAVDLLDDRFVAENVFRHVRRKPLDPLELGIDSHRARADQVCLAGTSRAPEHDMGLTQQLPLTQLVGVRQQRKKGPREDPRRIVQSIQPLRGLLSGSAGPLLARGRGQSRASLRRSSMSPVHPDHREKTSAPAVKEA